MKKVIMYYKNIPIINKYIDLSEEQEKILSEMQKNNEINIEIVVYNKKNEIKIYADDYLDVEYFIKNFECIKMLEIENEKIWNCVNMLVSLSDNVNFFVDEVSLKYAYMNFSEVIAKRNLMDLDAFMNNLETNKLFCFFALRDVIENLKVYLYLIRGEKVEKIIKGKEANITFEYIDDDERAKKIKRLDGEEKMNFNMKQILKNVSSISFLEKELLEIEKINNECNDYIHKNGYDKMNVKYLKTKNIEYMKEQMIFVIKVFFMVVVCCDGKSITSSDYVDCLDNDIEPIKDSQYWVAPIFQNFIDKMLTKEEKQNIIDNSYMEIN